MRSSYFLPKKKYMSAAEEGDDGADSATGANMLAKDDPTYSPFRLECHATAAGAPSPTGLDDRPRRYTVIYFKHSLVGF